jgi:hypothetical protein
VHGDVGRLQPRGEGGRRRHRGHALVCVESRLVALAPFPAGSRDLLGPVGRGVITKEHVQAELGELLAGVETDIDV